MNNHAPTADDIVEQGVAALRATPLDDRPPPALLDRTVAALAAAARAPRPRLATRLGGRLAAIAAAVALATAATIMIAVVLSSGSGSGSAFAAMLDKVRAMKSVRYRVTMPGVELTAGAEKALFFVMIETTEAVRIEDGPRVTVLRRDGGLHLDTEGKSAMTLPNDQAKDCRCEQPDLLGDFRQADGSWGEPIEGKQVVTVATRGYRVMKKWSGENDPELVSMRVYVDPATDLPVRVEQEVRLSDDDKSQAGFVLSDFEWDIEVDPALLSLDPPAGYRHQQWNLSDLEATSDVSPPEAIASGLRCYADHLKGALPSGIDGYEPKIALLEILHDEAGGREEFEALHNDIYARLKLYKQRFAPWFGLAQALEDFEQQNIKVHYLGKGLEAGDGSKIVAWCVNAG